MNATPNTCDACGRTRLRQLWNMNSGKVCTTCYNAVRRAARTGTVTPEARRAVFSTKQVTR